ncbi:hypothetical protein [Thiomonas sp. FB-6]|uniref:hypothetical protein n=1 Tax=Thiomonas sp. FB-6 TaxID=1158291 RepID=UPI00036503BF|nr:hypothetical protein [Thiomonas sp. FB-6]
MDISNLRTTVDPGVPAVSGAAPVGGVGSSASGANAPASGSAGAGAAPASGSGTAQAQAQGGASSQAAAQVSAESLHKAVQKINQQLEQSSGVTLSAGLDTSGEHPGQVLVELSDKSTRQTFFKYYVPAQQVVQASQNPGGGSAGALINAKA